jgi:hypothetical protein
MAQGGFRAVSGLRSFAIARPLLWPTIEDAHLTPSWSLSPSAQVQSRRHRSTRGSLHYLRSCGPAFLRGQEVKRRSEGAARRRSSSSTDPGQSRLAPTIDCWLAAARRERGVVSNSPLTPRSLHAEAKVTAFEHQHTGREAVGWPRLLAASCLMGRFLPPTTRRFLHR